VVVLVLCLLCLLGLGLPIAFLYGANLWNAHYEDLSVLSMARVPVSTTGFVVTRTDAKPAPVDFFDFHPVTTQRGTRRTFDADAYSFRAVVGKNPFLPPFGAVKGDGLVAGSEPHVYVGDDGRLPLGLGNAWFFAPKRAAKDRAAGDPIEGELVCFAESTGINQAITVLNDDIGSGLPSRFSELEDRLGRVSHEHGGWDTHGSGTDPSTTAEHEQTNIWDDPATPQPSAPPPETRSRRERRRDERRAAQSAAAGPAPAWPESTPHDESMWDDGAAGAAPPPPPPSPAPHSPPPAPPPRRGSTADQPTTKPGGAAPPLPPADEDDIWA
jgi:hypothetical protein